MSAKKTPIWSAELQAKLPPPTPNFNVEASRCVADARGMGVFFAGRESPLGVTPSIELGGTGGKMLVRSSRRWAFFSQTPVTLHEEISDY